jgi:hypothetical protein
MKSIFRIILKFWFYYNIEFSKSQGMYDICSYNVANFFDEKQNCFGEKVHGRIFFGE